MCVQRLTQSEGTAVDDAQLAAHLAATAGEALMSIRQCGSLAAEELGEAGDQAANELLVRAILTHRPHDGLLSEETRDTVDRLTKSRAWIIDPLDGTREFAEGRGDWAVHVGLVVDGRPTVGAVALPAFGTVLRSDQLSSLPPAGAPLRMVVSRTRPPREAEHVAKALGARVVPMGSAGAKAMAVVRGEADIYLHSGGQFEWDSAAPVAVAIAHGLHCSRIDGSELVYNQRNPYLPDLLVCRQEILGRASEALSQFGEEYSRSRV
jgi:3'(2'), 5'-bisphosphate nucleotidase